MSDKLEKAVSALTDALQQMRVLEQTIAGHNQKIAALKANEEELRAANQKAANELAAARAEASSARKDAGALVTAAQGAASKIISDAKEEARQASLARQKQNKDLRAGLERLVGTI